MELMTSVFLCALVALMPQALGKASKKYSSISGLVKNKFNIEKQLYDTNTITNFNVTSNLNKVSDLQSVFMNPNCKECHSCMVKSIKAHKVHTHLGTEIKTNDVPNEIDGIDENTTHRNKRNLGVDSEIKNIKKSAKKLKTKKSKNSKSVSVTKYSNKGNVYALRVKEILTPMTLDLQNQTKSPVSKCQVYRVTQSFSCNSPNADLIIREKKKISKTNVTEETNNETNLTNTNKETDRLIVPQFKKRHVVEEAPLSENFMPSIEEMY